MKFPIQPTEQVLLVPAILEGTRRRHNIYVILDTGATFTMISPEILERIGFEPDERLERNPISTASGIEYVSFVTLPALTVLGHERKGITVCVHTLPSTLPARGLLGLNFLRYFDLHLNFPQGYLEMH